MFTYCYSLNVTRTLFIISHVSLIKFMILKANYGYVYVDWIYSEELEITLVRTLRDRVYFSSFSYHSYVSRTIIGNIENDSF